MYSAAIPWICSWLPHTCFTIFSAFHQTTSYEVFYIDYGNSCQNLGHDDLWSWDSLYEMIPPQGHLCSLKEFPDTWMINPELFRKIMTSQKAMKMHIIEVSPSRCGFFMASDSDFGKKIELSVRLTTEDDIDLCVASVQKVLDWDCSTVLKRFRDGGGN